MAVDGIILNKIIQEIEPVFPAKINKIYEISKNDIVFMLHGSRKKINLLISLHSVFNRVSLTEEKFSYNDEPSSFIMLLRKYLVGGLIINIEQKKLDRWFKLTISIRNTIGDRETCYLYVELMGKYANLILVNQQMKIIDALKRIPPFENNQRCIHPGAEFIEVEPQLNKTNPYLAKDFNPDLPLYQQFEGISPLLQKEIDYRLINNEPFSKIIDEIKQSEVLYCKESKKGSLFHCIPLTHLEGKDKIYPIINGLDDIYRQEEITNRIKDTSADVKKICDRALKHQKKKLPKLEEALNEAYDLDKYREYGDLLFANQANKTNHQKSIVLRNFADTDSITIPLDSRFNLKDNALRYFHKYNKLKKAQIHLLEQIELCQQEIQYLESLLHFIEIADFNDIKEISEELQAAGYLKKQKIKKKSKKKKNNLPHIHQINYQGIEILYGKNNLQNDALTFKIAQKNDLWFHAKDFHGAHVVCPLSNPSEEVIRFCANLAAYYSQGRYSSSVPVNYTLVKNLKKIPKGKLGLVSLKTYKTIYIDPDESIITEK